MIMFVVAKNVEKALLQEEMKDRTNWKRIEVRNSENKTHIPGI